MYESEICACGFHTSLTTDKSNAFTFEARTCNVCGGSDRWVRAQHAQDEKDLKALGDDAPADAKRPADGRKTFVRLMTADEVSQRRAKATGPSPPER